MNINSLCVYYDLYGNNLNLANELHLKARLHWRFYLDENVGVLATVSMFVVMDVYDSQGKQIHAPWDVTF